MMLSRVFVVAQRNADAGRRMNFMALEHHRFQHVGQQAVGHNHRLRNVGDVIEHDGELVAGQRAPVSPERIESSTRQRVAMSKVVAASWPSVSLVLLKLSKSMKNTRPLFCCDGNVQEHGPHDLRTARDWAV
jgi:hypothetical protein